MNSVSYVRQHLMEHIDKVYRYARALTDHGDTAEDLAHEVCVKALVGENKFHDNDPQHLQAWLLCITYNEFTNWYRKQRIRRSGGAPEGMREHRVEAPQEFQIQVLELVEMLNRIPKQHRDIIIAYALTDMSYEDIAKWKNIPTGTVRSSISRGRTELKALRDGPTSR